MGCNENCNCDICDLSLGIPGRAPNRIIRFNNAADCFEAVPLATLLDGVDTKVSVDLADVGCPGYLYDKLTSSNSTINIQKETIGLCKKVDLTVNKNNLQFSFLDLVDTPSAYIDCTTQCGFQANAYVKVNSAGNGLIFDCECCNTAYASYTLTDNVIINQPTNQEKFYIIAGTAGQTVLPGLTEPTVPNVWNVHVQKGLTVTNGEITFNACTAGDYRVSFDGHREVNKGIHGARLGLLFIRAGQAYYFTETRRSGLSDIFYTGQDDTNHSTTRGPYGNNTLTTAGGGGGPTFSLGRHEERRPAGKTRIITILPGDKILPYAKLSTVMSGDADARITGQFAILGGNPGTSVTGDSGFNISLNKLG